MEKKRSRLCSILLCIAMAASMLPTHAFAADGGAANFPDENFSSRASGLNAIPAARASAPVTLADLQAKFPDGKYWNHAGNPGASNAVNNQDGYTSTPCPTHGNIGTATQTCNGFAPSNTQLSWQCMGYAEKLGYDYSGTNPRINGSGWTTYTDPSALDNLKAGDIVRYRTGHSIFVTAVEGDIVTLTDCNWDGHCKIRWGATVDKSTLKATFIHLRSGPGIGALPACSCSTDYAGTYICTTTTATLTIRSGHGTGYSAIGSIPPGATVSVCKADGSWAHVTYNGISGLASMSYLSKQDLSQPGMGNLNINRWLSESKMGSAPSEMTQGTWYYFCYELKDSTTGNLVNSYSGNNYTVTQEVYAPDGSKVQSDTCSGSDTNCVGFRAAQAGTYRCKITVKGTIGGKTFDLTPTDLTFTVNANPTTISADKSAITLTLGSAPTDTAVITLGGWYDGSRGVRLETSNSNVACSLGQLSNQSCPLTITAVSEGTATLTLKAVDTSTEATLAATTIQVTVRSSGKTLTYNANGGAGAPANQTGTGAMTISSTIPTRFGYDFLGWSTSSGASSASYTPRSTITPSGNTTLYAVWASATAGTIPSTSTDFTAPIRFAGQTRYFKYTPSATKKIRFESTGSADTKAYLYDANGTLVASDDNTGKGSNFRLDYKMSAGSTYYLMVEYGNADQIGTIRITAKTSYTVTYNANGGSGAPSTQRKYYGQNLTLSSKIPTKSYTVTYDANGGTPSTTTATKDCTFTGWNTKSSGTGTDYSAGETYSKDAYAVLYAKWENPTLGTLPTPTRSGYAFKGWYTASSGGTKVTGSTAVTGDTVIYAHWTRTVSAPVSFADVPATAWYAPYVNKAVELGLMSGVSSDKFNPTGKTSRAMFVQVLYAMDGAPNVTFNHPFTDVDNSKWYAKAVQWAYSNKVTGGLTATTFGPNNNVTREQIALFLYSYAGKPAVTGDLSAFRDGAKVSSWAKDAMIWATQNGIISGTTASDGTRSLNPKNLATRAETATMMVGFYDKVNK